MPFCTTWRKPQAESRTLSEIYKPPDGQLTKDVLLGEGGTGDVYKDEESVCICRELKFLQQFGGHKNIASYFGAYYRAPFKECSSELLEALYNLISKTNEHYLNETWIGYVCREILKGLHHIHKNRVVHRDIKSLNIMLTEMAKVKIIDFGNGWDLDPQTGLCHEAEGTPQWITPETIRQKGQRLAYDTKCDIWSLGITNIEMAEGKPRKSQHFVSFLESCLKKDPSERGSAEEFLQHPFITLLPPKKIVRTEIEEHLLTLQNRPAKRVEEIHYICNSTAARVGFIIMALGIIRGLKGVALWTLKQLWCACDFCTQTLAEQEAALQMALEGFSCY
ncbi:hypothetical protein XELAEV_18009530mg [Xenopus laevis]|uniref:Protein kinase domain-containing protein n=1 Tax=Xenopus laevis TaxID=8355 RepID=A0A974DSJ2_XENLA|nr:hypothetical protein XELAEV_18009530mg [Xenopus laevis]